MHILSSTELSVKDSSYDDYCMCTVIISASVSSSSLAIELIVGAVLQLCSCNLDNQVVMFGLYTSRLVPY